MWRRIARGIAAVGLVALLAIAALMLAPPLLGYERYVITGGSMGSALPRGSIAYERVVPVRRLRVGDVITFRPPGAVEGRRVTHRIVRIGRDRLLRTRGDANPARDPWTFWLSGRTQARVAFHVPLAGYALAALALRWVRMLVIGVPALVIAWVAFAGLLPRRRRRSEVSREGSGAAQLL